MSASEYDLLSVLLMLDRKRNGTGRNRFRYEPNKPPSIPYGDEGGTLWSRWICEIVGCFPPCRWFHQRLII